MKSEPSLLPTHWEVPQALRDLLSHRPGRQRVLEEDGHLLLVLHHPPLAEDLGRTGRFFWRDPDGNWMPPAMTRGEQNSLEALLQDYDQAIDAADDAEDEATTAADYLLLLRDLSPLVRATNNLHSALQKAHELVPEDRELLHLRDNAYGLARQAELLYTDAQHALDYQIALRGEEQAEISQRMSSASYRLNLLVAFFFPVATIAGIFGMNLHHPLEALSERDSTPLFLSVLGVGFVLGILLTLFVTLPPRKRPKQRVHWKELLRRSANTSSMDKP